MSRDTDVWFETRDPTLALKRRWFSSRFRADVETDEFPIGMLDGYGPLRHRDLRVTGEAPHWAIAVALATPPAWGWGVPRLRRWRRRRRGLCLRCGYNLRASGGRCPECGTVAPAAMVGVAVERP